MDEKHYGTILLVQSTQDETGLFVAPELNVFDVPANSFWVFILTVCISVQ